MKKSICVLLSLSSSVCMAATPASTADVDAAAAVLQTQVDTLNAIPAVAHPVGSCYGGGVVYYVNPNASAPAGQRGLIAALTDAPSGGPSQTYAWDTDVNTGTGTVTTSALYFAGLTNTANILNGVPINPSTKAQAATAANAYNTASTCSTCTAWYLPSQDELATLYFQSTNITDFGGACTGYAPTTNIYWSSTQGSTTNAWRVSFDTGSVATGSLTNMFRVRPVRAF